MNNDWFTLAQALAAHEYQPPVAYVYNPLDYARVLHERWLALQGQKNQRVLMAGMNPGPYGMAQTGVPFGSIPTVRDWLKLSDQGLTSPSKSHPKRPIEGFACKQAEISGARLWAWIRSWYGTPQFAFEDLCLVNICPLLYLDEKGANVSPEQMSSADKTWVQDHCLVVLARALKHSQPRALVGIGNWAHEQLRLAQERAGLTDIPLVKLTHPSPANPKARAFWEGPVQDFLAQGGVDLAPTKPGG